jgi:pimeloyl-ACP methyl ester carboxylesterase
VPANARSVELNSLRLVDDADDGLPCIEAQWRMTGDLALPWKPRLDLEGRTLYTLGGEGGRISSYDEAWAVTPSAALGQLLRSAPPGSRSKPSPAAEALPEAAAEAEAAAETAAEHWAGQLQGQPPPTPKVSLRDAPPVVVLPGFGNDEIDYIAPLEQPEEVGLAAALRRRGVASLSVVPVKRADWLNVLRGVADGKFWAGDAQPTGPAFRWYLAKTRAAVEEAVAARRASQPRSDPRALLVGHSAGGWLARAACLDEEWAKAHVRGIVTLGAPHLGPPPDVPDQTRGTVANLNKLAPGATLPPPFFYVTVGSARIVGDEGAPAGSAQRTAFNSYRMVCGEGDVAGDGIVPLSAAHLEGASQLTLDCFHSIAKPGTAMPTADWYGAEPVIDEWLAEVAAALYLPCTFPVPSLYLPSGSPRLPPRW